MIEIFPFLLTGFIVFTVYKLFVLFVQRKERRMVLEKLSERMDPSSFKEILQLSNMNSERPIHFATLKAACLLIGVGLGLCIAWIINIALTNSSSYVNAYRIQSEAVCYFSCTLLFGGIGLLIAYFAEKKEASIKK